MSLLLPPRAKPYCLGEAKENIRTAQEIKGKPMKHLNKKQDVWKQLKQKGINDNRGS